MRVFLTISAEVPLYLPSDQRIVKGRVTNNSYWGTNNPKIILNLINVTFVVLIRVGTKKSHIKWGWDPLN